jgi:hypothetical protein
MELGIVIWIVSACACAFWMSVQASSRNMSEFRWFLAGMVCSVLALPFFFYALRAAEKSASQAAEQNSDGLPASDWTADSADMNASSMSMEKKAA